MWRPRGLVLSGRSLTGLQRGDDSASTPLSSSVSLPVSISSSTASLPPPPPAGAPPVPRCISCLHPSSALSPFPSFLLTQKLKQSRRNAELLRPRGSPLHPSTPASPTSLSPPRPLHAAALLCSFHQATESKGEHHGGRWWHTLRRTVAGWRWRGEEVVGVTLQWGRAPMRGGGTLGEAKRCSHREGFVRDFTDGEWRCRRRNRPEVKKMRSLTKFCEQKRKSVRGKQ